MTIYYLYIKTHRVTGLKYFGQTIQDPFKYRGSGPYWKKHLQEYGYDIDTEIVLETIDKNERNRIGRKLSSLWNVVESDEWANSIPETGGGSFSGEWNPNRGKKGPDHPAYGRIDSEETKKLKAEAKKGSKNPFFGVTGKDHPGSKIDKRGANNPTYDPTIFTWRNDESDVTHYMTRQEFKSLGILSKASVDRLARGSYPSHKGWRIVRD